jgi:hypothetical protein
VKQDAKDNALRCLKKRASKRVNVDTIDQLKTRKETQKYVTTRGGEKGNH